MHAVMLKQPCRQQTRNYTYTCTGIRFRFTPLSCGKDANRLSGLEFLCKRGAVGREASEVGLRRASWPSGRCEMLPGRVHPEAWGVAAAADAAAACAEIRNLYKGRRRRSVPEWEFWSILIGRLEHARSYFGNIGE
jgi:hypothetical protein